MKKTILLLLKLEVNSTLSGGCAGSACYLLLRTGSQLVVDNEASGLDTES